MRNLSSFKRLCLFLVALYLILFSMSNLMCHINITPRINNIVSMINLYAQNIISHIVMLIIGISFIVYLIITRKKDIIFSKTEFGDFSISIDALVDMVKHAIDNYPDIRYRNIQVKPMDTTVRIKCTAELSTGSDIPHTVSIIQKTINNYIHKCTGIDVETIKIKVVPSRNESAKVYTNEDKTVQILDEFNSTSNMTQELNFDVNVTGSNKSINNTEGVKCQEYKQEN